MRSYPRSIWRTLPISVTPSAANAAISIAIPARMSGESTRWPCSGRGPTTIARCGSQIVIDAPIRTSLSTKNRRFSNIHSWIITEPWAWVASANATLVRSAGNAGHGPSCTLGVWSPLSLRITSSWLPGTITSAPRTSVRRPSRSNTSRIIRRSSVTVSLMMSSPPVTPASAMNEPISMWSGAMPWVQPRRLPTPCTVITFEPMPSICAPIAESIRARSWTCGSDAALRITVGPRVSAAAISAFSVAITEGSSIRKSHGLSPSGASSRISRRSSSTVAPSARKTSRCGSSRRRPITSPPGGGICARPKRASNGPASRNEARIRSASSRSTSQLSTLEASIEISPGPIHWTRAPSCSSSSVIASTSLILGTLRRITSSSVSRHAARIGSAPFLLPAGVTVPARGLPPSITNFSIGGRSVPSRVARPVPGGRPVGFAGDLAPAPRSPASRASRIRIRSARVPSMQVQLSRDEAWDLLCEWTSSDSLRRHMLAVEAAMRAYAPRFDGDIDLWGLTGLLHDLDYERYPNLEDSDDGHPRSALRELEARGYPPELVRAVASHADFLGVSRDSPMEKALFAVDELSGFVLAVAYVRPEKLQGMTPKSVKKKLRQPSFAAAVNREELAHGAEELGVDFDEHLKIVIDALTERREELFATG